MSTVFASQSLSKGSKTRLRTLGAISFVNTLPIYQGLELPDDWGLHYAPPATLNTMMDRGELDVSPVSSAFYLAHAHRFSLIPSLSVSSYGSVDSVLFVSQQPIETLLSRSLSIPVPDDSATSVALLAHLLQQQFGCSVEERLVPYAAEDFLSVLSQQGCGLIIGDRALMMKYAISQPNPCDVAPLNQIQQAFSGWHLMDLSNAWMAHTQTPIVFAVWVAQRAFAEQCPDALVEIEQRLLSSRDGFWTQLDFQAQAIKRAKTALPLPDDVLMRYWQHSLNYTWSSQHDASLNLWAEVLQQKISSPQDLTVSV